MKLARLWLTDVRCYESLDLAPADGLTALVGGNGQGKTSVLEAVAWLATARSFRGVPDAALVRDGAERAVVRGDVERGGRQRLIEAEIPRVGRNRVQVNRNRVPRAKALEETLRVTIFSPDDLELVKGGPSLRRRYLDDLLAATSPSAAAVAVEYDKVVRQRTALLRGGVRDEEARTTLEVWDDQLVRLGGRVVDARLRLLDRLAGPLAKAYADLAGAAPGAGEVVAGRYEAQWADHDLRLGDTSELEAALRDAVGRARRKEIDRGVTLVGPHRDEFLLTIDAREARTHASQGEQRSLALALRLAGHGVTTDAVGEPPVLLLDDVFSELDPARCQALVEHLPAGQALVTTASVLPDDLPVELRLRVRGGRVSPE